MKNKRLPYKIIGSLDLFLVLFKFLLKYLYIFTFSSIIGYYKILSIVPCVTQ